MDPMRELVIVLPGIGGSSLYGGEERIWTFPAVLYGRSFVTVIP